jgi:hypothetical protein
MEEIKAKLVETIKAIDVDKLSLYDLSIYMDIVKKLQELDSKSYFDTLASIMASGLNATPPAPVTIGDLKGE